MRAELAKEGDLAAVGEILDTARAYLKAQGLDQWQNFPPQAEETFAHCLRKELYVMREGNAVAGTFVLVPHEPAYDVIDGAWLQNGAYVAIHRVAVSPAFRRHGVASPFFRRRAKRQRRRELVLCGSIRIRETFPCVRRWKRTDLHCAATSSSLRVKRVSLMKRRSYESHRSNGKCT